LTHSYFFVAYCLIKRKDN